MHKQAILSALATILSVATSSPSAPASPQQIVAVLQANYSQNLQKLLEGRSGNSCQFPTAAERKSWASLTIAERISYLEAVHCLNTKPNKVSRQVVPGARNRLDNFTYSHINQTNFIHGSGLLLPWHRQFIWSHEQAMRTECGYTGPYPFWDWETYSGNQSASPIFDGTPTSFGGNGEYIPHPAQTAVLVGLPTPLTLYRAPGSGGGCVSNLGGLGSNFTIHLGPVAPANNTPDNAYGYQYNPRCLKRDFLDSISASSLNYGNVSTLLQSSNIHTFRSSIDQSMPPASHTFLGADGYDFYSSPTDPTFYLLHAQIDRLWTIWQGQDFADRTNALDGTVTLRNDPPSANATLDTVMIMNEAGGNVPIHKVMSAADNHYCYRYV